jgi:hypothetical protein
LVNANTGASFHNAVSLRTTIYPFKFVDWQILQTVSEPIRTELQIMGRQPGAATGLSCAIRFAIGDLAHAGGRDVGPFDDHCLAGIG